MPAKARHDGGIEQAGHCGASMGFDDHRVIGVNADLGGDRGLARDLLGAERGSRERAGRGQRVTPPEPIPITASSGSSTSPVPVSTRISPASATISMASSRRRTGRCASPWRARRRRASAGRGSARAPPRTARTGRKHRRSSRRSPAMTLPLPTLRTLRAVPLMTVWPSVTWPSPAITTLPPLRTVRIVVPCQVSGEDAMPMLQRDIGAKGALVKRPGRAAVAHGAGGGRRCGAVGGAERGRSSARIDLRQRKRDHVRLTGEADQQAVSTVGDWCPLVAESTWQSVCEEEARSDERPNDFSAGCCLSFSLSHALSRPHRRTTPSTRRHQESVDVPKWARILPRPWSGYVLPTIRLASASKCSADCGIDQTLKGGWCRCQERVVEPIECETEG